MKKLVFIYDVNGNLNMVYNPCIVSIDTNMTKKEVEMSFLDVLNLKQNCLSNGVICKV